MRILIVEDETAAYENLADMLVTIDPTLEIMGNTESVQQTVRWLQANPRRLVKVNCGQCCVL